MATKLYNIWAYGPNKTSYNCSIESPLISPFVTNNTTGKTTIAPEDQEIRVAIQWSTVTGAYDRRVVFYGRVKDLYFNSYRVDNNYDEKGRLLYANEAIVGIPKA